MHQETGQYALAAVTSGAYALSAALVSPVVGRLVDRLGAPLVLSVAAVANPLALTGLLVAAHVRASGLIPVAAACAGMTYPPLTAAIRSAWIGLTEGERSGLRQSALAVETSLFELVFVTGPLLVAICVLIASPDAAIAASAFATLTGTLVLARSPILRRPGGRPMTARTRGLGPLLVPGFVPVLVCVASLSVAFGAVSVTVPAFASQHAGAGGQSLAGILLAVWGLGSVIGGFGYGALRIAAPLSRQFGWLLAAVAVSIALLAVMPVPFAGSSAGGAVAGLIVDHPGAVPWSFGFAATVVAAWPSGSIKRADSVAVFAGELRAAALLSGDHQ